MSEAEVLSSIMRGHDSMMTVMSGRHRSLQIIYSLWHNKDLKACVVYVSRDKKYFPFQNIFSYSAVFYIGGCRCCFRNEWSCHCRRFIGYLDTSTVSIVSILWLRLCLFVIICWWWLWNISDLYGTWTFVSHCLILYMSSFRVNTKCEYALAYFCHSYGIKTFHVITLWISGTWLLDVMLYV